MRHTANLIRRSGVYYYRSRVPNDLIDQYQRKEIWLSLKTSVRHEAELKLASLHAAKLQEYSELRLGASLQHLKSLRSSLSVPQEAVKSSLKFDLDTLLEYWANQSEKRPRTLLDARTAVRRLKVVCKDRQAIHVDKFIAIAFKDALLAEGLAFATVSKNLGLVKSIFEVALNNGRIEANPFKDIKLVKPARLEKARIPFNTDDINKIFGSPVYQAQFRPLGGAGEAAYWLPLIALMTGMRLEEIGQLCREDVKKEGDIWFFDLVHEPDKGKTLKNNASCRRVPIHEYLIELEFLKFVNAQNFKSNRLFPLICSSGSRQKTASWSQWFGRYLREEIGITDKRKTFHSFRHTFKDICREYGVAKEIHDRITGHTSGDVGDGYGDARYPIRPLNTAINSINFSAIEHAFKRNDKILKLVAF